MDYLTIERRRRRRPTTTSLPMGKQRSRTSTRKVLRISKALLSEWKISVIQWQSLFEIVQEITNHSPSKQLGKNREGEMLSLMKLFTGLKPAHVLIKLKLLRKFRNLEALTEDGMKKLSDVAALDEV